jgi:hypothetical protein
MSVSAGWRITVKALIKKALWTFGYELNKRNPDMSKRFVADSEQRDLPPMIKQKKAGR